LFLLSLVVLLAVILVRIGWVYLTAFFARWRARAAARQVEKLDQFFALSAAEQAAKLERMERREGRRGRMAQRIEQAREARRQGGFDLMPAFSWQENAVISWTGMRGVVTLAAAAGIPLVTAAGEPFPGRDVIQVVAFTVTIGTLLLQGLTLPWLINRLGIADPQGAATRERQHKLAQELSEAAAKAAVEAFRDRQTDDQARLLAERMLARFNMTSQQVKDWGMSDGALATLGAEMLAARREAMVKARDERRLDDEVMREVLEAMDFEQAAQESRETGR
jgi:CPA1 family monovalent cation:H+ antiporter